MTGHGGDIVGYSEEYQMQPLDFSANISPLGVPKNVRAAAAAALTEADTYPDPFCRALCKAIAEAEKLPPSAILCGNGAADLIYRLVLAQKPQKALVTAPTFSEYEAALAVVGCNITYHTLLPENGYRVTETLLDAIDNSIDILFLCQPNNPTGQAVERELMLSILERCSEKGVLLVADECFVGFLDEPSSFSLCDRLEHNRNLIILKAFTKLYGMAGLRLGYALSYDENLLKSMHQAGQPWSVSTVAQAAGIAALKETAYVEKVRRLIQTERPKMLYSLTKLGLHCLPPAANFIFFTADDNHLAEKLMPFGIMIRSCSNYRGLSDFDYRIAIRKPQENRRLLSALREALHER
jgi:threonine-phosphate decarboxylase